MAEEKTGIALLFEDNSLSELSDDFKQKATVIFETAVAEKVIEEKKALEEEYKNRLEEQRKEVQSNMEDKIDSYLSYVAEEWMKENKLAVENGIQQEIAENFLAGMKDLFEESYVEVPKSRVNLVSELTRKNKQLESKLNEAVRNNMTLNEEVKLFKQSEIIAEHTRGMADTEVERVYELAKMIDYEDDRQYTSRIKGIVEGYFKQTTAKNDDGEKNIDKETIDESMQAFVAALSRSLA